MSHIIGLTGAFGSGCSTAAKRLRDERGFHHVLLSRPIRDEWKKLNPRGPEPSRKDLQRLGDEMRLEHGADILVTLAINQETERKHSLLAVDGIRNPGEVRSLRERFGHRFLLIAVVSSPNARWARISTAYTDQGQNRTHFIEDDTRDSDEEIPSGQRVQLCVDLADVVVDNSDEVILTDFGEKILDYVDLVTRRTLRHPTEDEILMNLAYAASHSSKCLKRHVGAVIVKEKQVVGVGYNENPLPTKPCAEDEGYDFRCYRDLLRNERFEDLSARQILCPACGKELPVIEGPPWRCESCRKEGRKTNLEDFFFPDRAMTWCTAVHAELWAVLAAAGRARGSALYSTTFPCFQCCEKLTQAGVEEVVYTEAYPDALGQDRLERAGIRLRQFEGVRSASFERIFQPNRPTS